MTYITCWLTAKNRDQLRNPTLGNRVWTTFTFFLTVDYTDLLPVFFVCVSYLLLSYIVIAKILCAARQHTVVQKKMERVVKVNFKYSLLVDTRLNRVKSC